MAKHSRDVSIVPSRYVAPRRQCQCTIYMLICNTIKGWFAREVVSENVPLYDKLMRSPASRASINVYCGLSDIAAFMDSV